MTTMDCPYHPCGATVTVVGTPPYPGIGDAPRAMIMPHQIQHQILRGTCPASLMYVPLDDRTREHLLMIEAADSRRISGALAGEGQVVWRTLTEWAAESQSLRGPHRIGREPDVTDIDDWQIGGREDEDAARQRDAIKPPKIPVNVAGQEIGRHVASIDEIIGLVNTAAMKSGEGIGAMNTAIDELTVARQACEEAKNYVLMIMGTVENGHMSNYASAMNAVMDSISNVIGQLEEAKARIEGAQSEGEQFIGKLLG